MGTFRNIGRKAVDIRRADLDYLLAEEQITATRERTGVFAAAVGLGFIAGLFNGLCRLFRP